LFLFINNVHHKNHNRIIENHSEFSGCLNRCNKYDITYDTVVIKAPPPPLPPFWKGKGGNVPAMFPFSGLPVYIILHALALLVVVGYNVSQE